MSEMSHKYVFQTGKHDDGNLITLLFDDFLNIFLAQRVLALSREDLTELE